MEKKLAENRVYPSFGDRLTIGSAPIDSWAVHMLPNFVAKFTVEQRSCLTFNGRTVLDQFEDLRAYLIESAGRDAAALFAEPVLTRKVDDIEIAWYAEQSGQPVPLETLDPDAQGIVLIRLRDRLQSIAPLLSGPRGAILGRALYVADARDIMAVGQEPLFVQWGVVPNNVSPTDQTALTAHFARTVGRYSSISAPLIGTRHPPDLRAAPPDSKVQPLPLAPMAEGRSPLHQHLGLIVASAVAALVALCLTLPNILAGPLPGRANNSEDLTDARHVTKALRDKVEQARGSLAIVTCDPSGRLTVPDGRESQLPPAPIPIQPSETGNMNLVARRATESVVFIFTCTDQPGWDEAHKDDKEKGKPLACPKVEDGAPEPESQKATPGNLFLLGSGSGFFVAPKTIVTNFHVVRNAQAVFVTNRFLGRAKRAMVTAMTPAGASFVSPDFALLNVEVDRSPPPIELATAPQLLENVVAAGFPAVVIAEDLERERLFHGDMTAAPGLTTFPGSVTLIKYPDQPMQLIYSSAVIGHGNSGGPLLDLCARALGMNTFGWSGTAEDTGYKINIAEGAKALSAFLDDNHVTHGSSTKACEPGAQAKLEQKPPEVPPVTTTPPSPTTTKPDAPSSGFGK